MKIITHARSTLRGLLALTGQELRDTSEVFTTCRRDNNSIMTSTQVLFLATLGSVHVPEDFKILDCVACDVLNYSTIAYNTRVGPPTIGKHIPVGSFTRVQLYLFTITQTKRIRAE